MSIASKRSLAYISLNLDMRFSCLITCVVSFRANGDVALNGDVTRNLDGVVALERRTGDTERSVLDARDSLAVVVGAGEFDLELIMILVASSL